MNERIIILQTPVGRIVTPTFNFLKNNLPPFLVIAVLWEAVVLTDVFPDILMPSIAKIGEAFWRLLWTGRSVVCIVAAASRAYSETLSETRSAATC